MAGLDLAVLALDLGLLLAELVGLFLELLVGLLQLFLLRLSSSVRRCDWRSKLSVRMVASMVATTMPKLSSSCSRKATCTGVKRSKVASSITPLTSRSNTTGTTTMLRARPRRGRSMICT